MSDNWIVQNLENALKTWNDKLSEIWQLITQSPEQFKGGSIWNVIVDIHGAVQAIGLALLVLFFVIGVMKTCGSFVEVKKPEHALKLFIRFALAKGVVTYGLELMMALFNIVQGLISNSLKFQFLRECVHKFGVERGTGTFIYALSADETSPALAAPRHAITTLFSCCFKRLCPPRRQPYFRSNADRAYNTLHFASKVVCQGASPFGNPGQQNRLNISHFPGA